MNENKLVTENKTDSESGKRLDWLDVLKCLAMFCVVCGHVTRLKGNNHLRYYIYSFHMPIFFILSGIGMYLQLSRRDYTFRDMLKGKVRTLLWPYLCLNLLLMPHWILNFRILYYKKSQTIKQTLLAIFYSNQKWHSLPSSTTWFITCLFISVMLFFIVVKWCRKDSRMILLYGAALGMISYVLPMCNVDINYPWHMATAPMGCMLMAIGYVFMENYEIISGWMCETRIRQIAALVIGLLTGFLCARYNVKVSMAVNSYGSFILFIGAVLGFTVACWILSMWLPNLAVFRLIGRNTIIYLAIHEQVIRTIEYYSDSSKAFITKYPYLVATAIFFGLVPIAWFVEKYCPVIIGRKKRR